MSPDQINDPNFNPNSNEPFLKTESAAFGQRSHVYAGLFLLLAVALTTGSALAQRRPGDPPSIVANGRDLGPEEASKTITATVWLKQRDKAGFDALVEKMYTPGSSNYHQWLTLNGYKAKFAPADEDAASVRNFLSAHNLTVTTTDKFNHYVTASGRVSDVQKALNVEIHRFEVNGAVRRVPMSEPFVTGSTAKVVSAVQVGELGYKTNTILAKDVDTGMPYAGIPVKANITSDGKFFNANCFRAPETQTFTTNGGAPSAVYTGNRFGSNITSVAPNLSPCGYQPSDLQVAYGLNEAYKSHWTGNGQVIVIVDAYGSNTIAADANEFSTLYHLPQLTSSNFGVFSPNGPVTCNADCVSGSWYLETTLDVEWAHAIAPKAAIALITTADASFTNLDIGNLFAVENLLGNVISNSFGISEIVLAEQFPSELIVENNISELAAALGISQNISSGDDGDYLAVDKADYKIDAVSVSAGASAPYATAIGGTSTFLTKTRARQFETGWGLNFARIANPAPNPPTIPPLHFGFQFGSGGGTSVYYKKPMFQKALSGKFRKVPDIAMDADPETGVEIIITPDQIPGDQQEVDVIGGTSLACPMFSGLWAIANEAAGVPLGQAAPYIYSLTGSAINDVTDLTSGYNVAGVIFNPPDPPLAETADLLAAPETSSGYISALFNSPTSTRWDVFTFGTDSSLVTGPGWDNVTGVGTPNAVPFIQQVVALSAK